MLIVKKLTSALVLIVILLSTAYSADYHLGGAAQPLKQIISLNLDPQLDAFSGSTAIELEIGQDVEGIDIYAKDISMSAVVLKSMTADLKMDLAPSKPSEYDIVTLRGPQTISRGRYQLSIEYTASISNEPNGLYKFADGDELYLATQLQAMKARTVFPSFDEPSFKIPFQMDVTAPSTYQVLGNSSIHKTTSQGKYTTHYFKPTASINTDVLAVAVGKFTAWPIKEMEIPSTIYTIKGQQLDVEVIRRDIPKIFKHVQSYFNSAYPFEKLDFLLLPVYSGAGMENVGLITLHQDLVTFPNSKNEIGSYESHKLIAHEIIHMWFGNLVTMKWWDDLWLNESFSEWLARKIVNNHFQELGGELDLPQLGAFWDDTPSTPAIKRQMKSVEDYNAIGQIVYTKGHAIISMVEQYVGELAFKRAIVDYTKQFSGKNVSFEDFIGFMEKHTNTTLFPIFDSFLTKSQYPLVTLTSSEQQLQISQQPFAETISTKGSDLDTTSIWHIPLRIKFITQQGIIAKSVLLNSRSLSISLPKGTYAVFADGGALGYFRYHVKGFETDSTNWLEHLSNKEKRSLLANNGDLVKGGYLKYVDALALQLKLLQTDSLDHELAIGLIDNLNNDFYDFVPLSLQGAYRDYLTKTVLKTTTQIRWYKQTEVSDELRASSLSLLGAKLLDKDAINFATSHYQSVLNNTSSLSELMQSAVLEVVASNGTKREFNRFKQAYITSKSEFTKDKIIRYMGYFSYQNSVVDYYNFLFSSDLKATEFRGYYLQYSVYNPKNRSDAIDNLEANISKLFARVSEDDKQWQPYSFASGCSMELRRKLNLIYQPYFKEVKGLKEKLHNVNHMISSCENMQKSNHSQLEALLLKH